MKSKIETVSDALRTIGISMLEIAKVLEAEEVEAEQRAEEKEEDHVFMTPRDAAIVLQCVPATVINRFNRGIIKGEKIGGRVMLLASSVNDFNNKFNSKRNING